jgi:hypothetical protein
MAISKVILFAVGHSLLIRGERIVCNIEMCSEIVPPQERCMSTSGYPLTEGA